MESRTFNLEWTDDPFVLGIIPSDNPANSWWNHVGACDMAWIDSTVESLRNYSSYSDATNKHSSSSTFYLPSLALPQTWLSSRCWSDITKPGAMLHSIRFMSNHQLNAKDGQSSLSMSRGHRGMNKHRACERSFSFLDFTSISRQAPYFPTSRPPFLQKSPWHAR